MAANSVEFIIKARDEASAAIQRVSGATTDLRGALTNLVTGGGVFGIIAAGAVAATGAVVALGSAAADTVERLDRTAGRTGVTIEKLQAIQEVVEQGGGSFDSVVTALTFLNRSIATSDPILKQLGITTRDTYQAFQQLASILGRSPDAAKRTEVAFRLMGRGAGDIIGQLKEIAASSDAMQESLAKSGSLFTGQAAEGARKLDGQLDQLGQQWRSLVKSFQILATPLASLVVGVFDGMLKAVVGFFRAMREGTVGVLEDLSSAAKSQETFAERIKKAQEEARKVGGHVQVGVPTIEGVEVKAKREKDPLDVVNLSEQKAAADSRRKRLEELRRVLNLSRADAERYLRVLEAVETETKRVREVEALRKAGISSDDLLKSGATTFTETFPMQPRHTRAKMEVGPLAPIDPKWQKMLEELLATAPKVSEAVIDIGIAWGVTIREFTSATSIMQQGLEGLWNGLQNGFGQVFANLTNRTQTLRSALKTIFAALVQEVLAMLARIAAAKLFGFILKLIPGLGTAAGLATDVISMGKAQAPVGAETKSVGGGSAAVGGVPVGQGGEDGTAQGFAGGMAQDTVAAAEDAGRAAGAAAVAARAAAVAAGRTVAAADGAARSAGAAGRGTAGAVTAARSASAAGQAAVMAARGVASGSGRVARSAVATVSSPAREASGLARLALSAVRGASVATRTALDVVGRAAGFAMRSTESARVLARSAAEGVAVNARVAARSEKRSSGVGVVNIYALDRADIERSLADPRGTLRQAFGKVALTGVD